MSNLTKRFLKRLRDELGLKIPDDAHMVRTGAGRHQKSAGAFSSVIVSKSNQIYELGLYTPIRDLMKCQSSPLVIPLVSLSIVVV